MNDAYLTRTQAAERRGVSVATIDRWVREGRLTRYRPAGNRRNGSRYRQSELDALLVAVEAAPPRT